jgi:hypothetical protein
MSNTCLSDVIPLGYYSTFDVILFQYDTDITRSEPAPSLFTVPAGFTVPDVPQPIVYRTNQ